MKRLLIDSSSILQGCLHAAVNGERAQLVTFEGKDVSIPSALDGYDIFRMSLDKTLSTLEMTPIQIVLVKDGKNSREVRRKFLSTYKNRTPKPAEFMAQFNILQDTVEATLLSYGAVSVVKEGFEADDLIAALAATNDSLIWSKDGDLLAAGDLYFDGEINPDKFFGIKKEHIVVYKSLVGDTSDKIPGCPGFGKTAFIDMVAKYGDEALQDIKDMLEEKKLEELAESAAEFKPFAKVMANLATVYASYQCAQFIHPGYKLEWKAAYPSGNGDLPRWKPTMELITGDNFSVPILKNSPHISLDIETYVEEESLVWALANKSKTDKMLPLDIFGSKLTGFSLNYGDNCQHTKYYSFRHKDTNNLTEAQVLQILNSLPTDVPIVVHNSSFELCVLRNEFELKFDRGYLPQLLHDTRIMSGCVDEYESQGLKPNSKLWLNYDQVTYDQVTSLVEINEETGEEIITSRKMNEMTGREVTHYGCDDSICTSSLYSIFTLIMNYEDTWNSYEQCDIAAQFIYAEAFLTGVKFDLDKLSELETENKAKYEELEIKLLEYVATIPNFPGCNFEPAADLSASEIKRVYQSVTGEPLKTNLRRVDKLAELIGGDLGEALVDCEDIEKYNDVASSLFEPRPVLNIRSPKQMTDLLYVHMGLKIRIRNNLTDVQRTEGQKEGNPSSDGSAINHAIIYDADERQQGFLKVLLEAKSCLTENGLFYTPYREMPSWIDGYVHPQSGQSRAKSGRANASKPNFQQVSKKSRVREVYVPLEKDHVWVSFDVCSQELVIIAVQSNDQNMLDCYRGEKRKDVHSLTGVQVLKNTQGIDLSYDDFLLQLKDKSAPLHDVVNKSRKQAKSTNFLDAYCGTALTLSEELLIKEELAQKMLDGKATAFPDVKKWQKDMEAIHRKRGYAMEPMGRRRHLRLKGNWEDAHELRAALNHIIQGGAGTQIKRVLTKIWNRKVLEMFRAFFLFTVYDEINFSVHKDDVVGFIKVVHPIMVEKYCDFPVDFESSIEIGQSFGELIEVGTEVDEAKIKEVLEKLSNGS